MTVNHDERLFLRDLPPKRLGMCPHQQKEQDRKLRAALLAEFNDTDLADRAMKVIKGQR